MKVLFFLFLLNFILVSCKSNKSESSTVDDIDFIEVPGTTDTVKQNLVIVSESERTPRSPFMKEVVFRNSKPDALLFNFYKVEQNGIDSIQCIGLSVKNRTIILAGLNTIKDFDNIDKVINDYLKNYGINRKQIESYILSICIDGHVDGTGLTKIINKIDADFEKNNFENILDIQSFNDK